MVYVYLYARHTLPFFGAESVMITMRFNNAWNQKPYRAFLPTKCYNSLKVDQKMQ